MSMFDNYNHNSGPGYNLEHCSQEQFDRIYIGPPIIERDRSSNIIKFTWKENDEFILEDSIDVVAFVDEDSRIYTFPEDGPTSKTKGVKGQRAYNTVDWKCWICLGQCENCYCWKETALDVCKKGTRKIIFTRNIYNKTTIANILDFRHNIIYTYTFKNSANIQIPISKQETPLLVQGQYILEILLKDENSQRTLKTTPISIT